MKTVASILHGFNFHPVRAGRELRDALQRDPPAFLSDLLKAGSETSPRGYRYAIILLVNNDILIPAITSPETTTFPQALRLTRGMLAIDGNFINSLVGALLLRRDLKAPARTLRGLELIAECAESLRNWKALARIHREGDNQVRARCASLIARRCFTTESGLHRFRASTPRIRANIVETLVEGGQNEADHLLSHALRDEDSRVAANACLALYAAGDTRALLRLKEMLASPDPSTRISAAWILGRCRDGRFISYLLEASGSEISSLSHHAAESLAKMEFIPPHGSPSLSAAVGESRLEVVSMSLQTDNDFELWLHPTGADRQFLMLIRPVDFIVWTDNGYLFDYSIEERYNDEPSFVSVVFPAESEALRAAFTASQSEKPATQIWNFVQYSVLPGRNLLDAATPLLKIEPGITDHHIVMIVDRNGIPGGVEHFESACALHGIRTHYWYLDLTPKQSGRTGIVLGEEEAAQHWPRFAASLQARYILRAANAPTAVSIRRTSAGKTAFFGCAVEMTGGYRG